MPAFDPRNRTRHRARYRQDLCRCDVANGRRSTCCAQIWSGVAFDLPQRWRRRSL